MSFESVFLERLINIDGPILIAGCGGGYDIFSVPSLPFFSPNKLKTGFY